MFPKLGFPKPGFTNPGKLRFGRVGYGNPGPYCDGYCPEFWPVPVSVLVEVNPFSFGYDPELVEVDVNPLLPPFDAEDEEDVANDDPAATAWPLSAKKKKIALNQRLI